MNWLNSIVYLDITLQSTFIMNRYEILSLNRELLLRLHKLGIKTSDYIQVDIYNDFLQYKAQGDKVSYAVLMLSKKYNLSERSIYKILKLCTISYL